MTDEPSRAASTADLASALTSVWERVLGLPATADGDFFSLGGNSLKVVQIIEAIEAQFPIEFPTDVLFFDGRLPAVIAACEEQLRTARS